MFLGWWCGVVVAKLLALYAFDRSYTLLSSTPPSQDKAGFTYTGLLVFSRAFLLEILLSEAHPGCFGIVGDPFV